MLHDPPRREPLDDATMNFLATVSSDLRTPLTVIQSYIELLLRGHAGELSDEQREMIEAMRTRADMLSSVTRDVIIVATIEADALFSEPEPIELWEAVDQAVGMLRRELDRRGVRLSAQVPRDLPPVLADRAQLQIILRHLIENAWRSVDPPSATVTAERHAGFIHVSVSDTGPGIPPELHEAIFTYFPPNDGWSPPKQGSGLGLAIAKHLIERQGGRVWVTSQVGVGSTFSVSLPIAAEPIETPPGAG